MTFTRARRSIFTLAALVALTAAGIPGSTSGPVAALLGSGPVSFGSMLTCGFCIGVGAGMIYSGEFLAFLGSSTAWKSLGVCAAACVAVVGS